MPNKWNPQDYSEHSSAQTGWALEGIRKLELRGNEKVLDLGCGDGKITAEIARSLPAGSVTGVDYSPEMINFCRKTFPDTHFPNLSFRIMDISRLEFDNEFDIIFSNASIHWVENHLEVLHGIYRALRSGGRTLLQMGGKGNASGLMDIVGQVINSIKWKKYFAGFVAPYYFYGTDEYYRWASEAGLHPLRIELIKKDMAQKGKEGLASWFRTTWLPYLEKLPEHLKSDFISELVDNYTNTYTALENGDIVVKMVRLEAELYKK